MDDKLLWLSLIDAGQSKDAEPPQRGRRDAEFHDLQLPGAARRCVHARPRRHGHREPHRAGAFIERRAGQLPESEP